MQVRFYHWSWRFFGINPWFPLFVCFVYLGLYNNKHLKSYKIYFFFNSSNNFVQKFSFYAVKTGQQKSRVEYFSYSFHFFIHMGSIAEFWILPIVSVRWKLLVWWLSIILLIFLASMSDFRWAIPLT